MEREAEDSLSKVVFVILSLEGPDKYSHAGGLGSRVTGLSDALAGMGFETHVFFIGDPELPGHEVTADRRLHLHRWCQWISRYHPGGVYDGEEGKLADWNRSIPDWLEAEFLPARVARGDHVVIIAEEWQNASAAIALHEMAGRRGWLDRIRVVWNANNTYGFDRIDWERLKQSAAITTVSRFMKHTMWTTGVDPIVIPNGIPSCWLEPVDIGATRALTQSWAGRLSLVKMGRWDPNKRWQMAVDAVAELKRLHQRPLLLARGGCEAHGQEVVARAESHGLRVRSVRWSGDGIDAVTCAIRQALDADVILLETYVNEEQRRPLFHAADAVLANSGVEPFGLVGLETMAVGGVALVGATGEDYATPGHDSVSLQTADPGEIVRHVVRLQADRRAALQIRAAARRSAARYTWESVICRNLLPEFGFPSKARIPDVVEAPGAGAGPRTVVSGTRTPATRRAARGILVDARAL